MTIIVAAVRPAVRPPAAGGGALQAGDIWVHQLTSARERYDGAAWSVFAPITIYQATIPTVRPTPPGGALQADDIWVQSATGLQARWSGTAWEHVKLPQSVPSGGRQGEHLAKAALRAFDTEWVDPSHGIAFLFEQRVAAQVWNVRHEMRCEHVTVTCIDHTRSPQVTMVPDIEYFFNECNLYFISATRGYAIIHASKPATDFIAQ